MTGQEHRLADYRIVDGIAVLAIDHPPVNALSHVVRIALAEGVDRAISDPEADALVLICRGRTFFAGADVRELGRPIEPPLLADVMGRFEASSKPIVSAMHGTALGGGFELTLAGHFRVGVPSLVVGLPEVALGLLPGAGGTQRVPRLVGPEKGLELIGLGRQVKSQEALDLGLVDAILPEGELEPGAVVFARKMVDERRPLKRVRDVDLDCSPAEFDEIADRFRRSHPELFVGLKAPAGAVEAVRAAATLPFDEGIAKEREIAPALTATPESAAQRHLFFAERAALKLPEASVKARAPSSLQVCGELAAARQLGDLQVVDGPEMIIVAVDKPFEAFVQHLQGLEAAPVMVAAGHLDRFDDLRTSLGATPSLVGLNEIDGIWEIVIDEHSGAEAAAAVMGLSRYAGIAAVYARPAPGLVVSRIRKTFLRSVSALREEGANDADILASAAAYGFGKSLTDNFDPGGSPSAALERRLVADCAFEAGRMVEEGAVLRGSDIDFAVVKAGLWPLWRGGPAFVWEREGVQRLTDWRAPLSEQPN